MAAISIFADQSQDDHPLCMFEVTPTGEVRLIEQLADNFGRPFRAPPSGTFTFAQRDVLPAGGIETELMRMPLAGPDQPIPPEPEPRTHSTIGWIAWDD